MESGEPLPLFYEQLVEVVTEPAKADRVWKGLKKKVRLHSGKIDFIRRFLKADKLNHPLPFIGHLLVDF